jgi:hypothetical protein
MKTFVKIFALSLCLILCFTSCSLFDKAKEEAEKIKEEVVRVKDFSGDFVELVQDPTIEKAEDLVHPSSNLSAEAVVDKIKNNETIKNLELSENTQVELGEISGLTLLTNDATLGGNVYGVDMTVIVDGTPITINLKVLSTSGGMGVYDFDLQ